MSINIEVLKQYADVNYNVLLTGRHGVGKTAVVKEIFNEKFGEINKGWRYFSASTIDPWVDFVGIPKNYTNADGKEVFAIIPPEHFTGDEQISALFFDEINRADEKTLNAIMELIQFKSINGRKFPNLRCIWAAENPSDTNEYSVRELDKAQRDRFHIQIDVPYVLDKEYFEVKFGEDIYNIAKSWWQSGENRNKVSPRKLDSILDGYIMGFNISDFTNTCDVSELKGSLASIGDFAAMRSVAMTGDAVKIKKLFTMDKIRTNEVILKSKKNKNDVFDNIYEHVDAEIQDYISKAFSYNFVKNRKDIASGLDNDQMSFFVDYKYSDKIAFESSNAKKIFDGMKDVTSKFNFEQILDNEAMDYEELEKLFIFDFNGEDYRNNNTSSDLREYVMNADNKVDKDSVIDYVRLVVMVADRISAEFGADNEVVEKIVEFVDEAFDNIFGSVAIGVSVIQKTKIIKAICDKERVDINHVKGLKYVSA